MKAKKTARVNKILYNLISNAKKTNNPQKYSSITELKLNLFVVKSNTKFVYSSLLLITLLFYTLQKEKNLFLWNKSFYLQIFILPMNSQYNTLLRVEIQKKFEVFF